MSGLNYLLQTNLYLVMFMGFYALLLKNETFFRHNRIYLNSSIILSFAIPFFNTQWFRDLFITQKLRDVTAMPTTLVYDTVVVGLKDEANAWSLGNIIIWIYVCGVVFFLLRFLVGLFLLRSNLKLEKGSAFSFFNHLVVDKELPNAATIIDHEKVHIRQWHSADIILIEMVAILNWFNPVIYLYNIEIRHIHEFIADEEAANLMQSKSNYALLLFSNTMGIDPTRLSNNFFNKSLLKRRISMLNKTKSRRTGLWKYGFSAPLFAMMLIFSAASVATEKTELIARAEQLISPLKADKNTKIIFSEPTSKDIYKKEQSSPSKPKYEKSASESKNMDDISALRKHIQRNIKYPSSARQNKITGYVLVNFKIKDKKISNVQVAKSLQNDVDNEVLRTLNLFNDAVQAEDDNYSLVIAFQLIGIEANLGTLPSTGKNRFLGSIVVSAIAGSEKTETSGPTLQLSEVVVRNFTDIEVLPEFHGGMSAWSDYMRNTLKYPEEAKKNQVQGRVILRFIVMKDGSIAEIKVLRGIGSGADEEAIRVVKASPKWKPGLHKGEPVNVAYTMPIFFTLPPSKTN